jgi:hypothetical protein
VFIFVVLSHVSDQVAQILFFAQAFYRFGDGELITSKERRDNSGESTISLSPSLLLSSTCLSILWGMDFGRYRLLLLAAKMLRQCQHNKLYSSMTETVYVFVLGRECS